MALNAGIISGDGCARPETLECLRKTKVLSRFCFLDRAFSIMKTKN